MAFGVFESLGIAEAILLTRLPRFCGTRNNCRADGHDRALPATDLKLQRLDVSLIQIVLLDKISGDEAGIGIFFKTHVCHFALAWES